MSLAMTEDEILRALIALGVPRARAGLSCNLSCNAVRAPIVEPSPAVTPALPIRLTLPWSALCSDNDKYGAVIRGTPEKHYPKLILTAKYRAAKAAAHKAALAVMTIDGQRAAPLTGPVYLHARVYVPDNRPGHDVANFAKCAHDAFQKVLFANDDQLHDVRWVRAGVNVDAPRAEIEVGPSTMPATAGVEP